ISVASSDEEGREKRDEHPEEGKRVGKSEFVRPENFSRRENQARQNQEYRWKAPGELEKQKPPARQIGVGVDPVRGRRKRPGEMLVRPNEPRDDEQNVENKVAPVDQPAKAQPGFAEKNREQTANRGEINESAETFRQAGEAGGKPKTGEPCLAE